MKREVFLIEFRPLAKRYSDCLAEIHRHGIDKPDTLDAWVIEEIKAIHDRFMEISLDDIDMKTVIWDRMTDPDTESFPGQWNRITDFVIHYEEILGEDPEINAEYEEWKKERSRR